MKFYLLLVCKFFLINVSFADLSKRTPSEIKELTYYYGVNAVCALTNAVRIDPKQYLSKYGNAKTVDSCASTSPSRNLVYMHGDLCAASLFHAKEMATYQKMTHNSLSGDKGPFNERIWRFFKDSRRVAENLASGDVFRDAVELNNGWIASPGHCKNVMSEKYNAIGLGFSQGLDSMYAAESFAGIFVDEFPQRIACGSHLRIGNDLAFMVAVSKPGSNEVYVVIDGQKFQMKPELQNSQATLFRFDGSQVIIGENCARYYFQMGEERYPVGFDLETQGYKKCLPFSQ